MGTSACATHWTKKGATGNDFDQDHTDCEVKANLAGRRLDGTLPGAIGYRDFMDRCMHGRGWSEVAIGDADDAKPLPEASIADDPQPKTPAADASTWSLAGGQTWAFEYPASWTEAPTESAAAVFVSSAKSEKATLTFDETEQGLQEYAQEHYPEWESSGVKLGKRPGLLLGHVASNRRVTIAILIVGGVAYELTCTEKGKTTASETCMRVALSLRVK